MLENTNNVVKVSTKQKCKDSNISNNLYGVVSFYGLVPAIRHRRWTYFA